MEREDWVRAAQLCLIGVVIAALVILGGVAVGGGANFDWNGQPSYDIAFSPGDQVEGSSSVWIRGRDLGKPEDGPFFAYLSPQRRASWPPPEDAIGLGEVTIDPYPEGASHSVARVSFAVPDVPPGDYLVLHCNDSCTTELGDITPTLLTIAAGEADERATVAIDRLDRRTDSNEFFITRMKREMRELRGVWSRIADLESSEKELAQRVSALEFELAASPATTTSPAGPLGLAALGGLTGLGIAHFGARRRSHADRP